MNRDGEFERLRQENLLLRQALAVKDEQMKLLKQENQSLQEQLFHLFGPGLFELLLDKGEFAQVVDIA
jgi:hypothetical protein